MATNPNHRYGIYDTSRGSRLLETAQTEDRAIARANVHTFRTGSPVAVIDRHNPILRETNSIFGGTRTATDDRIIYKTHGMGSGNPAYQDR